MATRRFDPAPPVDAEHSNAAGQSAGLHWTWHPLVDMGIATLVALADREQPEEVTTANLEWFAAQAERALRVPAVRSHASVLFTVNVPYLQPSFPPPRREQNARELFRAFASVSNLDGGVCVYCSRPAVRLGTGSGRAYRELIPLLTGQGTVNFAPYGEHGLPVCGLCVTALHALVLGAPNCEGRALIVSADDPSQIVSLLRDWLPMLQRRIQLSEASDAKLDPWKGPRTRLLERLVALARKERLSAAPSSFTIYHASNSGQGPDLRIHTLSAPVVGFVNDAQLADYRPAWHRLESRAWHDAKRRAAAREPDADEQPYWRNTFYEALFRLPDNAGQFVRTYFRSPAELDVKSVEAAEHAPLWPLVELFLEEVLGVEAPRIEAIRTLADRLAQEIEKNNDLPLLGDVLRARHYVRARYLLVKVGWDRIKRRNLPPLLSFDEFLLVFETGEEVERRDWRLAWDLMLVRLLDHISPWLQEKLKTDTDAARELGDMPAETEDTAEELVVA